MIGSLLSSQPVADHFLVQRKEPAAGDFCLYTWHSVRTAAIAKLIWNLDVDGADGPQISGIHQDSVLNIPIQVKKYYRFTIDTI